MEDTMIITKTPFRMSFFGGGTDLPSFFEKHNGAVISTTFDKYVYVTVRHLPRFFDYKTEIKYSIIERVKSVDEIEHPMIRNAMKMLDMHELYISYDADLPGRTGLGTSSTFAVGLLNAFYSLKGKFISKQKIAKDAIFLERTLCNEEGGWQDQIAASYGGFNRIDFSKDGFTVTPIIISPRRKLQLEKNLLLFFTGFTRLSSSVQEANKKSMKENEDKYKSLFSLVDRAQNILQNDSENLDEFGKLLAEEWHLKKQTSDHITSSSIDIFYEKAINAGAIGGKLLGAGGGGFLLFYANPEVHEKIRKALKGLMEVPFSFEDSGTKVVYYTPEVFEKQFKNEK